MSQEVIGALLEKRRRALMDFCIGQIDKDGTYHLIRTDDDLLEILRTDPKDNHGVQTTEVARAIATAQDHISAAYNRLEPGFPEAVFPVNDVKRWDIYGSYTTWSASQLLRIFAEDFIIPGLRLRKTLLFQELEQALNQTRLSPESVQVGVSSYLKGFEDVCNMDVCSAYSEGPSAGESEYYIVSRKRVPPYGYYLRQATIDLAPAAVSVNPASWGETTEIGIPLAEKVLDMRPLAWNRRACVVWAEVQDKIGLPSDPGYTPYKIDIQLSFKSQTGLWSPPLMVQSHTQDTPPDPDSRLIALIKVDDEQPLGRLGVVLLDSKGEPVAPPTVRDVLYRPLIDDDGTWVLVLAERFVDALTVQHTLTRPSQPQVVITIPEAGLLTGFLLLEMLFFNVGEDDVLAIRGVCKANKAAPGKEAEFELKLLDGSGGDPEPYKEKKSCEGGWATPWQFMRRKSGGFTSTINYTFGAAGYGRKQFALSLKDLVGKPAATLEKNRDNAAQFLAFNQAGTLARTRLNSLFGPQLVQLIGISLDALLDWSTQWLTEPPSDAGPVSEPNGAFDGANGLYFWELFFHLAHLLAVRLREEGRYSEARDWLHRLFNPQEVGKPSTPPQPSDRPAYWGLRTFMQTGHPGWEANQPEDPDAIAYSTPRHFQLAVYSEYVENLIGQGDFHYRQLTPDSLVAAKQAYIRAKSLLGETPSTRSVSDWDPATLGELLEQSRTPSALEEFERNHSYTLRDIACTAATPPDIGMEVFPPFKVPINERLLELFEKPRLRLNNLRNNLSIDGTPLNLPLYSRVGSGEQLLRDLAASGSGGLWSAGTLPQMSAFDWRAMMEFALRTVQTLRGFGEQLLRVHEMRDRAEQEETQQDNLVKMGEWSRIIQEKNVAQAEATLDALRQSRAAVAQRVATFSEWHEENVTPDEEKGMRFLQTSKDLSLGATGVGAAGAVLAAMPKIFGVATGGFKPEDALYAVSRGLSIAAQALQIDAEKLSLTEGYKRRRREWDSQLKLAKAEMLTVDQQIRAQEIALEAAHDTKRQNDLSNAQAQAMYNYLKKRSINANTYGWLVGQLSALYYQVYDAALGLCSGVQASLAAATGEYDAEPLPRLWENQYKGFLVGEHLHEYLMRIERKYLQTYERRLERVATFSLRALFDNSRNPQFGAKSWEEARDQLTEHGTLTFEFTQRHLDERNPGEYCRLIRSVDVTLPAVMGPYEDVNGTLEQTGSRTLIRPSIRSVEYLYDPDTAPAPNDVVFNTRSGQRIALSSGVADNGLVVENKEPGLLSPFEYTGAVSQWRIVFAWHKKDRPAELLESINDIIVTLRYTAKTGDATFRLAVMDLVTQKEARAVQRDLDRSGNHD